MSSTVFRCRYSDNANPWGSTVVQCAIESALQATEEHILYSETNTHQNYNSLPHSHLSEDKQLQVSNNKIVIIVIVMFQKTQISMQQVQLQNRLSIRQASKSVYTQFNERQQTYCATSAAHPECSGLFPKQTGYNKTFTIWIECINGNGRIVVISFDNHTCNDKENNLTLILAVALKHRSVQILALHISTVLRRSSGT
ncbi:hypothetical protein F2P81_024031 [Scophthalmus maximus]|uniref:Uncharacterized protein n=1 Tax=Scophthalmus maximus TaxID=52904 RepID=A0A6A4RWC6_SCOMX|nr:hypothetical protein F2P81_024031 [Scophthalmus maximus]